jgi:hypothetical protein
MALNKFSEGGNTYFQLFISCPVCHDRGRNTERSFWAHYQCNGDIFVGDNAFYKCKKCGKTNHVKEWSYNCPSHSSSPDEFVKASSQGLAQAVSTAGQMVMECGQQWLMKFLSNMGEF